MTIVQREKEESMGTNIMTSVYQQFVNAVYVFMENPSKENAQRFVSFINDFWANHEMDLYYGSENNLNDEYSVVDDVMMLCDRFDECDEIVAHDQYCIDFHELYDTVRNSIERIKNPVYE